MITISASIFIVLIAFGVLLTTHSSKIEEPNKINNANAKVGHTNLDANRTLVIYFTESANTYILANIISDEVGGDLRILEPVNSYPSGEELKTLIKEERDNDIRPEFKDLNIHMSDYDTIFIGYPIWAYTMPMMLYTFFDEYDLSGKTIIPFNTHEGTGNGGTYETIKSLEPNAKVLNGLSINDSAFETDQSARVKSWFKELGILS